jgi:hypothetical protein
MSVELIPCPDGARGRVAGTPGRTLFLLPLLPLLVLLGGWSILAQAAVTATLDRQQLYEGERLRLTIEVSGQGQGVEPDLGPLEQDFDILGTSSGSQFSIINGRASSRVQWQISLAPKRLGELSIPALEVGDERTEPLHVQVLEVPEGALGGPGDDVFVELTLERPAGVGAEEPVMVQQQLPLVVRLYSALPLRGGSLSDPRAEGAGLERLGPDRRFEARRDGRDYQVIERRYSLSPERSGELRIPPVVFEGELTPSARAAGAPGRNSGTGFGNSRLDRMFEDFPFASNFASDPLSLFEPGQPVRAQSEALRLQVAARPEDFAGQHWLPAEALSVEDSWAAQPPSLAVGEPVTRTLTLVAKGLAGSQIPDVDMGIPADVRGYREPTANETRTDGQAVFAVSRQAMTLIPTRPGRLELPELRVRWWDIKAQRERETLVPALSLAVAAGSGAPAPADQAAPAAAGAADHGAGAAPAAGGAGREFAGDETEGARRALGGSVGWSLVAAVLGLLALAAGGVWAMVAFGRSTGGTGARARVPGAPGATGAAASKPRLSALREAVRLAAAADDAKATADALLTFARARWPADPPLNLGMLARRFASTARVAATGEVAAAAVTALERNLYAPAGGDWSGEGFWDAVRVALGQPGAPEAEVDVELPELYPSQPKRRDI